MTKIALRAHNKIGPLTITTIVLAISKKEPIWSIMFGSFRRASHFFMDIYYEADGEN